MRITRSDRRVITFYSYKGGVGRTMALANVAFRLADVHALDVVAVDWDLEAPGLHEFFGVPEETLASARGVLDYFLEWREAARRKDPRPPDGSRWLIRVDGAERAPRNGSLSLLIAGRVDNTYDARLSTLDWSEFYANAAGALAVETLRRQLVQDADVVLVDSRTGLTDAGGICTIQLPDGVVLMTTPNRQSLRGIEGIARSIARATPQERAGRARVKAWLSVCRMPSEETSLAEEWIRAHAPDFEQMLADGVLLRDDHAYGLETHAIPQRARWGFDESLLKEHAGSTRSDPLLFAYEHLTVTILDWVVGPFERDSPAGDGASAEPPSIEELEKRAADAEARRDGRGQLAALVMLGDALRRATRMEDAACVFERAADIALGAGLGIHRAVVKIRLAIVLKSLDRHDEAVAAARVALELARDQKSASVEAEALAQTGFIESARHGYEKAIPDFTEAIAVARACGQVERALAFLRVMAKGGKKLHAERVQANTTRGRASANRALASASRKLAEVARMSGETSVEIEALETLLDLTTQGMVLPDAEELRARLDSLKAGGASAVPVAPPTKDRARQKHRRKARKQLPESR